MGISEISDYSMMSKKRRYRERCLNGLRDGRRLYAISRKLGIMRVYPPYRAAYGENEHRANFTARYAPISDLSAVNLGLMKRI